MSARKDSRVILRRMPARVQNLSAQLTTAAVVTGVATLSLTGLGMYRGGFNAATLLGAAFGVATSAIATYNINCLEKGSCVTWSWVNTAVIVFTVLSLLWAGETNLRARAELNANSNLAMPVTTANNNNAEENNNNNA